MPGAPGVEPKSFQLSHAIRAICFEVAAIREALGGAATLDPQVDAPLFQLDLAGNAAIDAVALRKAADAMAEALAMLASQLAAGITLNAPTITDFTNAQHDHLDADDGGLLMAAAISNFNAAVIALLVDLNIPDNLTLTNITQITNRDHGALQDLTADDHTQYALLAGRAGGQSLIGGTAASENLTLESTSHGTKGSVISKNNFVIGDGSALDFTLIFNTSTNDGLLTWSRANDRFEFNDDVFLNSTERIYFRDSELFIYSSVDGQLDIEADTLVRIGLDGDWEWPGNAVLRTAYPTADKMINLGKDTNRINDIFLGGRLKTAKGADVASASTLTLGGDGNSFDITGTTTINYITTTGWPAGSRVLLQFDGALTVTHNAGAVPANTAAIKLAGAANFAATADDVLELWYDGSFWREAGRSVI